MTRDNTQVINGLNPKKRYTVRVDDSNYTKTHFIIVNDSNLQAHALVDESDEEALSYTVDLLTGTVVSTINNKLLGIYKSKVPDLYGITHIKLGFISSSTQKHRKIRVYEVI